MFRVVTPATDRSLLSIEEVRAAAGVTGSGQDEALSAIALSVSDMIARECGVVAAGHLPPALRTEICEETFRRTNASALRLSRRFVTVTDVTESGVDLDPASYEVDESAGILIRLAAGSPRKWGQPVVVAYSAGFGQAPPDLKQAAISAFREIQAAEGRDPLLRSETVDGVGRQDFQIGGSGRDSGSPLPPGVVDALGPYSTVSVG